MTESPWWLLLRGVAGTDPRLAAMVAVLAAFSSLLPTAFSLASGLLVGSLSQTVAEGMESPAGQRVMLAVALLGGLFVLQQVVGPLGSAALTPSAGATWPASTAG